MAVLLQRHGQAGKRKEAPRASFPVTKPSQRIKAEKPPLGNPPAPIAVLPDTPLYFLRPSHNWRLLDWRSQLASRVVEDGLKLPRGWRDLWIGALAAFLRKRKTTRNDLGRCPSVEQFPGLYEAWELSRLPVDRQPRLGIESLILAGAGDDEIAQHSGSTAAAIRLFHDVWFDVRDRLRFPSIIVHLAICRGDGRFDDDVPTATRRMSYFLGQSAALALLQPTVRSPLPKSLEEIFSLLDGEPSTSVLLRVALAIRTLPTEELRSPRALVQLWSRLQRLDCKRHDRSPQTDDERSRQACRDAGDDQKHAGSDKEVLMSPVLISALEAITDRINVATGLTHIADRNLAKEMFVRLREAGEPLPLVQIETWALEHEWQPRDARELGLLALRIADGLNPRIAEGPWWPADIIDQFRAAKT